MYPQKLFDKVVTHLRQQGKKAVIPIDNGVDTLCQYLTPDGLKCAVGCLILPGEYDPNIEGQSIGQLWVIIPSFAQRIGRDNLTLLNDLQGVHDQYSVGRWEEGFRFVADRHGLIVPEKP